MSLDLSEFRLKLFGPKWIRVFWEQKLTKSQSILRGQQKGCEKVEDDFIISHASKGNAVKIQQHNECILATLEKMMHNDMKWIWGTISRIVIKGRSFSRLHGHWGF